MSTVGTMVRPGAIAQLGERSDGIRKVVGSSPTSSTNKSSTYKPSVVQSCHTLSQKICPAGNGCLSYLRKAAQGLREYRNRWVRQKRKPGDLLAGAVFETGTKSGPESRSSLK